MRVKQSHKPPIWIDSSYHPQQNWGWFTVQSGMIQLKLGFSRVSRVKKLQETKNGLLHELSRDVHQR